MVAEAIRLSRFHLSRSFSWMPRRFIATLGGLGLALALAGCGGSDEPASLPAASFTWADAERLADVRPVTPGWPPWPHAPEEKQPSSETPEEVAARDPIYAEFRERTADLAVPEGDDGDSYNKWKDDDKLANLVAAVYVSADDAHVGFLASNDLSLGYGDMYGSVIKAESVEGLGDEAWRLWASGNGTEVTYHWRRDNLVVEAHVHCYGDCPSDVDAAARAWANAIDEDARSRS
jgi:hypothetical protein